MRLVSLAFFFWILVLNYLQTYRVQIECIPYQKSRSIIGKTWEDCMTNEELFHVTNSGPLSSRLKLFRLRWAEHVNRLPRERLHHMLLHSVLKEGSRPIGRPKLRFKNVLKRDLKDFNSDHQNMTDISQDRDFWHTIIHQGQHFDARRYLDKLDRRCFKLHLTIIDA